jgi:integrase
MKLFEVFRDTSFSIMNKDEMEILFHLGTWTGLRLIDCALMQWDYINTDTGKISCVPIKTKKSGKRVIIPIHHLLNKALEKAKEWKDQGSKYVLPETAERYKRNPFGVQEDTAKVIRHAGFETTREIEGERRIRKINVYGFHSLRHSFVSFCAKYGVPLAVVQSIVGHGNPAMTRHYVHIGDEAVKQAINALPQGQHLLADNAPEKPDSQKIKEAVALLNSKAQLTGTDKQLLKILR